jgi:2,4-dienoyl-CoA reductase-like NADH-dependent reductase (Old Yellow Enzyme family)
MPTLFDPIRIGSIEAANRIVMAPLTRDRASRRRVTDAVHAKGGKMVLQHYPSLDAATA